MPYTVDATAQVPLPEDPVLMAEAMAQVAAAWRVFRDAVEPLKATVRYEFNQSRAKPQRVPRKPKLVEAPVVPELVA